MLTEGDATLATSAAEAFQGFAAPGRWNLAAVVVGSGSAGYFLSDAARSTSFHIGSVTKTMTALTLAAMSLDGRVRLDDPLSAYLPGTAGDARLIELATHTSGYPRLTKRVALKAYAHPRDPYAAVTDRDVDRALRREVPDPRQRGLYSYSNFGFGALGRALAAAAGMPFGELVSWEVLVPLGLHQTTLDMASDPARVVGHGPSGRPVPDWHNPHLPGCGCLWSTIEDLETYLRANLDPEATPLSEAIRLTHVPRAPAGPGRQIALGWLVNGDEDAAKHWHNGATSGFQTFIGMRIDLRLGVAVLASHAPTPDLDLAAMELLDRLATS